MRAALGRAAPQGRAERAPIPCKFNAIALAASRPAIGMLPALDAGVETWSRR